MRVYKLIPICLCLFLLTAQAHAALVHPDKDFSLYAPDGWTILNGNIASKTPAPVKRMLDCSDNSSVELKQLGWKGGPNGEVLGAYCISYKKSGFGKVRESLKSSTGKERESLSSKYVDSIAGGIQLGYGKKRQMKVIHISGDLFEAGPDLIMVMDGQIEDGGELFIRSSTVFLHGDAQLSIDWVRGMDAAADVVTALESMPVTLEWK
ncbi:hypothetical protein LJC59_05625 [Desulfovibrio sp. OttesenSCG-928-A18]|nr:hypothetical protein [Desulfovibrio sp. OttesenSCG-928-A18]